MAPPSITTTRTISSKSLPSIFSSDVRGWLKTGASREFLRLLHDVSFIHLTQSAVFSSVGEVDRESDEQPDDQAPPVFARQRQHQKQANQNARDRNTWKQRSSAKTA